MKKRKARRSKRTEKTTNLSKLPPEIRALIKARTVRISEPCTFFAKQWQAMLPALGEVVSEKHPHTYTLERSFFEEFVEYLDAILGPKETRDPNMRASDWLALALETAGKTLLPADYESEQQAIEQPNIWPADCPFTEAWKLNTFPDQSFLPNYQQIFEYSVENGLKPALGLRRENPRLGVRLFLTPDHQKEKLPELTISLTGDAVWLLLGGMPLQSIAKTKDGLQTATQIWGVLSNWLSVAFGTKKAARGRPKQGLGFMAAWLRYHEGKKWPLVARELCQQEHTHNASCTDNFRKQADQYWESVRQKYRQIANASVRPATGSPKN